uniref:Photosynthetic NDH subcomplex B 2 n=1 Tax=Erodium trifolium TaxID=337410 RepID=A0A0F7CYS7_9ROSI
MASLLPFSLPKLHITKASSSSSPPLTATTAATAPPTTVSIPDTLNEKFGRKGIKFVESNNTHFVEMTVRNGSSTKLQIPNAHVTSYMPKCHWEEDGGFEEVLYTVPGSDPSISKGGVGLVINDASDSSSKASLLSNSRWTVKASDSDAIDAVQVELSCTAGTLDITYVVTLYPQSLATAVKVTNTGRKAVTLTSAILSHLKSKNRNGTAIDGLRACSFCTHPPLPSPFELLSPSEAMKFEDPVWYTFEDPEKKQGLWTVQEGEVTNLGNKMSRIYAAPPEERLKGIYNTPPSKYETIDQGRKLFFRVIRMGFEDIYVSSPGSLSKKYGNEYFICTGPASVLVPVVVDPGEGWRGAQVIEHDNL